MSRLEYTVSGRRARWHGMGGKYDFIRPDQDMMGIVVHNLKYAMRGEVECLGARFYLRSHVWGSERVCQCRGYIKTGRIHLRGRATGSLMVHA